MRSRVRTTLLSIGLLAIAVSAQEPPWNPANVKPCDRACRVASIDRYVDAMVTMETFGIRGGRIHEVEVFPFVVVPYGTGNGWAVGAGRK